MIRLPHAVVLGVFLLAGPAIAAEGGPNAACMGKWVSADDPTPRKPYEVSPSGVGLKVLLANDTAPPKGRALQLFPADQGVWKTAAKDPVRAEYRCDGKGKPRLSVRHVSVEWTGIWSTDLKRP